MRALVIAIGVLAATPAAADTSINMGIGLGVVMGHGPLAERLDTLRTVGFDLTFVHDRWSVVAGFALLDGERPEGAATAALGAPISQDLWAAGISVGVRRRFDKTGVGAPFVGGGFSLFELDAAGSQIGTGRLGVAYAPKVSAGLDLLLDANNRRGGLSLAATYQVLIAAMHDGARLGGGYAGLELTMLWGVGT